MGLISPIIYRKIAAFNVQGRAITNRNLSFAPIQHPTYVPRLSGSHQKELSMALQTRTLSLFNLLCFLYVSGDAIAAETAVVANNVAAPSLARVSISLVLVIGLLVLLSVLFKKFGLNRMNMSFPVKIVGAMSLGRNQRIVMIEVDDEWILLGVTPQQISTITTMPRQEEAMNTDAEGAQKANLPTWMQGALQKYAAKKKTT